MRNAKGDKEKVLLNTPKDIVAISIVGPTNKDNEIKNVTLKNVTILKRQSLAPQVVELDNIKNLSMTNVNFE